ncbi:hypothetical protein [Thermophilibacter sp.]
MRWGSVWIAIFRVGCKPASHNPKEYNGYKDYGADGCQITVEVADAIQAEIGALDYFDDVRSMPLDEGVDAGLIEWVPDEVLD